MIRAKYKDHAITVALNTLPSQTLGSLKQVLTQSFGLAADEQDIRLGYPPKSVDLDTSLETPLDVLNIKPSTALTISARPLVKSPEANSDAPSRVPIARKKPNGDMECIVPFAEGFLMLNQVPDDNSCLFHSVSIVLQGVNPETNKQQAVASLRDVVAFKVISDSENYNEAILGMPAEKYANRILQTNAWGGAIELAIFAETYQVQICCVDVQSGRLDRYSEHFPQMVCLCYSGIHYDAITLTADPAIFDPGYHQTRFDSDDAVLLVTLTEMAAALRKAGYFTDTQSFTLKCEVCAAGITGQSDALEHMRKTGHDKFQEYA